MCFSAQASFIASVVLSVIGLLSVRKTHYKNLIPFALIPFFFGIQQFFEGIVWLTQNYGLAKDPFLGIGTYGFLFFAFVVWPIWVPLSLWCIEKNKQRKQMLVGLLGIGIIWALYVANYMIVTQIHTSVVCCDHVQYLVGINYPDWAILVYAVPVVLSFFVTTVPYMGLLGLLVSSSLIGSRIIFNASFVSVWCFFAAIISLGIYWMIDKLNKKY